MVLRPDDTLARAGWVVLVAVASCAAPHAALRGAPPRVEHVSPPLPLPSAEPAEAAQKETPLAVVQVLAPACPAIDEAKLAPPVCDLGVIATPIPPIVDPRGSLSSFYEHLAALARGRASDHVRIAMYGDSNLTLDGITGRMRRHLQARLGDGGHGWVSLAHPWGWYQHEDVRHSGTWRHFRQIATSTDQVSDAHYGLANIAAESASGGAAAWVATARDTSPVGRSASRFDLFYLRRPDGGTFDVLADGKPLTTLSTRSPSFEAGFERFTLPEGAHELRMVLAGHGTVRFFGVAMEREVPGVVIDSLGAGALNFEQMAHVKSITRTPMIERRGWDLVAFQLGTNMFALNQHKAWAKAVIADIRAALPSASVLLVTPADFIKDWNDAHSDPRIVAVGEQLREIAAETGAAFWDFREAMGGDASIRSFMKKDLAEPDRVHLKKAGAELMADRMLCAMLADLRGYLASHASAGCSTPTP